MNFNQHLFVLYTVNSLIEVSKRAPGRTLIQKTLFVANELHQLQVPFDFILYKHGPYSFDVDNAIHEMSSYRAVKVDPVSGYGVTITPGEGGKFVGKYGGSLLPEAKSAITEASRTLAPMNVKELERIATAVWIYYREGIREPGRISERLRQLKPHISDKGAQDAVGKLQDLLGCSAS